MNRQETVITKSRKKPGPPATGKGTLVGVRLQPRDLAALDAFTASSSAAETLTRPQAIRTILADWLESRGFKMDGDGRTRSSRHG